MASCTTLMFMGAKNINNYICHNNYSATSCWASLLFFWRENRCSVFTGLAPTIWHFFLYGVITHSLTCSTRRRRLLVFVWMPQLFVDLYKLIMIRGSHSSGRCQSRWDCGGKWQRDLYVKDQDKLGFTNPPKRAIFVMISSFHGCKWYF